MPTYTPPDYTRKEELLHASTHFMGILLGYLGLILFSLKGLRIENLDFLITGLVFSLSLIALYTSSTLYHGFVDPKKKRIMKIADHACIYILIAGSYTPFTLLGLKGFSGWSLFALIWTIALLGVIFKIFYASRFRFLSTMFYILMSLTIFIDAKAFFANMPGDAIFWMLLGGGFYFSGTFFYLLKKIPYNHAIWHLFVLSGSLCHFVSIYVYLLPVKVL